MTADESDYISDEDYDRKQHEQFLDAVKQLDGRNAIKKPSRTEPTLHVSEFDLVKSQSQKKSSNVHVKDLAKALKNKEVHVNIGKKLLQVQQKSKTLRKPLEKPQAERVRRTVGFEKAKERLKRWDPVVQQNRTLDHIRFPLLKEKITYMEENKSFLSKFRIKNELEKVFEKFQSDKELATEEIEESEFPINLQELIERRKDAARLRAHQSYQEAKARRKNKIKSKKYHRIQRKEKIKQQMQEFERLQKTDPEAALRKLEDLEKTRAEERITLRHRSTGQWARNKQVRAKYDKESRQALAQQLAISRDLTQKISKDSDSDDVDGNEETIPGQDATKTSTNPWLVKPSSDVESFLNNYRKYWDEKNKKLESSVSVVTGKHDDAAKNMQSYTESVEDENMITQTQENKKLLVDIKSNVVTENGEAKIPVQVKRKSKNKAAKVATSAWRVEEIANGNENSVDNMFENLKTKMMKKAKRDILKSNKNKAVRKVKNGKKGDDDDKVVMVQSDFHKKRLHPDVDEELITSEPLKENDFSHLKELSNISNKPEIMSKETDIDPSKFATVKPIDLPSSVPDLITYVEEDDNQRELITEAFAGDDVVAEFAEEKRREIIKNQPSDVDLTLPGWGSWGGRDIKTPKWKKKRFILKLPKVLPRRDENCGNLILNEDADKKTKLHLVSEVPFPFTKVRDYEASLRAPLGRTFIPETSHKMLTRPAVITKMGTVIEPMDESQLVIKQNEIKKRK